jgi:mannosyltransferase
MVEPPERTAVAQPRRRSGRGAVPFLLPAIIVSVAAGLRFWALDSTSLWYDEIVTMRVARTTGPAALVERLDQIDGTRAPLHPLILQLWLRAFGPSDLAGRSFSALCGLGTVVVIFMLGRLAFDEMTGRWAAWLAAVCPPLVYYSQEARMYAWLVLLTCLSWLVFFWFRRTAKPAESVSYWLLLTSLVYSHPLGIFMVAAHGLSFLLVRPYLRLTPRLWLTIHAAVLVSIAPWLRQYTDHGTDYAMPRHSIRFLLAVPIEYVGGNSIVLVLCVAIIVFGMLSGERVGRWLRLAISKPVENLIFVTWAAVPPLLMYIYSYLAQPIFGPPRYHLFIAPAYLILLAHGLSRLPAPIRWPLAFGAVVLSLSLLQNYQQAMKADWRGLSAWLKSQEIQGKAGGSPPEHPTIVIHPSDSRFPREQLEAARYYLSAQARVIPARELSAFFVAGLPEPIYEVHCLSRPEIPGTRAPDEPNLFGIRVKKINRQAGERG